MSIIEQYANRRIPEYYDEMYQDGFTPQEIYIAHKRKTQRFAFEYFEAQKKASEDSSESILNNVKLSSEIKVKKK